MYAILSFAAAAARRPEAAGVWEGESGEAGESFDTEASALPLSLADVP